MCNPSTERKRTRLGGNNDQVASLMRARATNTSSRARSMMCAIAVAFVSISSTHGFSAYSRTSSTRRHNLHCGLQPTLHLPSSSRSHTSSDRLPRKQFILLAKNDSEDSPPSDDRDKNNQLVKETSQKSKDKKPSTLQTAFRAIGDFNQKFWAYITIALGVLFTGGLVLNLCGYAYQLNFRDMKENGTFLRIDTIQQFRTENEWRREIKRYELLEREKMEAQQNMLKMSTNEPSPVAMIVQSDNR